ncbi:MAG: hypothetical protein Q7K45_05965 [Nanoarchaeota archaeon]|nr:hypothetical protein [Nanoarchaeota archaeon]
MVKQFLITRPRHDKETSYLHSFSKAIVQIVKENRAIRLTELDGLKANRKEVESSLSTTDQTLAFFNGHGDEETIYGHDDEPILDRDNVQLMDKKIVYALACSSLVGLGKLAIQNGARTYIGYRDEFMWVGDPSASAIPDKDKNAAPFRKVCHILIHSLVRGMPTGKSLEKTKAEYKKLIRTYGTSEDDPFGDVAAIGFALSWDLTCLDMIGDANASF